MGPDQDEEAAGHRYALLTGLLVATTAAALAFGRVYQGTAVTHRLVLAGAVAAVLAAVLERRHVLLSTLVSAAALLVAVALVVFPHTTRWALPTLTTLRSIWGSLGDVGREAQLTVAPAPPVPALVLAGLTAVWTSAFASHSLATRARSPFLALTPPAALLAFAGIVVEDGARPGYVLLFLIGALCVLFADAMRRIGHWGALTVWRGRRALPLASPTTRGAWRVAAGCLSVALFVPWLLPGFGSPGLLSVQGDLGQTVSLNPLVDIRPRLLQNPAVEVFRVRAERPSYWRIISLDTFDGRTWSPSDPQAQNGVEVTGGALPTPPVFASPADVGEIHAHVVFGHLAEPWLPVPYQPEQVDISKGPIRYDPSSSSVVLPGLTYPDLSYDVRSQVVSPTPAELEEVPSLAQTALEPYIRLPTTTPARIRQIALSWTAGATTPYDKVMAIQQKLRSFTYDLRVRAPDSVNDLLYFLTVGHRGYCQQFAGSMAVLLRSLGIPARVAVGFTQGTYDPRQHVYRVRSTDYHSWVEVLFPQYGWLAFEPTPTRTNPIAAGYNQPIGVPVGGVAGCPDPANCANGGQLSGGGKGQLGTDQRLRNPDFRAPVPHGAGRHTRSASTPAATRDWVRTGFALGAALALLVLVAIPVVKAVRRRVLLARRGDPRSRVLDAYRVTLERAGDLGRGRRPGETPQEYRARLGHVVAFSNGDFEGLTGLTERAAYALDGPSRQDAERAARMSRIASRDIRRSAEPWRVALGWFRVERSYERPVLD